MDLGYHEDGILYVAFTEADVRRMEQRRRWQQARGLQVERWSCKEIARREPNVDGTIQAGFFFPTEAQVENVKLMQALAIACRAVGVTIKERTTVQRVLIRRRTVVGVQTDHGRFQAPIVVNCLGSWASRGGPSLPKLPVTPAKGQMLAFEAPKRLFRHIVMSEAAYGVQRRDGRLIVGSTVEFVGFDRHVTMDGMHQILTGFRRLATPEAYQHAVFRSAWAGLRPCTTDRLPILGPTSLRGLYVATGHFRHGILLAPITAKLLTELILQGRPSLDLSSFSISRFASHRF
jgi:glycine oxidase